ncbi:cysteine--1-D-myo-inosityl 2-amino-2-deoxy-alpha-D-glucopyranoside ligase [Microbacteriaceae bacterium 4G12]
MRSWSSPSVPELPGTGPVPRIHDTASQGLANAVGHQEGRVGVYVCGITPYDATHMGHAATYVAFDTLQRVWRDAGFEVRYVQNVTDVDDPLLERADATGVEWRELAEEQTNLFRWDMESLSVLPPDEFIAVSEVIDEVAAAVGMLLESGFAYRVAAPNAIEDGATDVYFDVRRAGEQTPWTLGEESNYDLPTMLSLFAERGGDPDREGKRNRLDPLLWLSAREGEPAWDTTVGRGRPGWHIECAVIALQHLDDVTVQGGGSDLIFPHHEMSAGHASALTGKDFACLYSHAGMVAYEGEKMSKSLGNLVLVSKLRAKGVDPRAIRLALLANHYRSDWEWTAETLSTAEQRLQRWLPLAGLGAAEAGAGAGAVAPVAVAGEPVPAADLRDQVREHLANDLDAPSALVAIDEWVARHAGAQSPEAVAVINALLGVDLTADPDARPPHHHS